MSKEKKSKGDKANHDRSTDIGRDANDNVIVTGDHATVHHNVFKVDRPQSESDIVPQNPQKYLRDLQANTSFIDIRGLQVGSGKATRFPIDELYIKLTGTDSQRLHEIDDALHHLGRSPPVELHEMLRHRRLVVVGDPGSGKTTFARRIAAILSRAHLDAENGTTAGDLGLDDRPLPIFIRVSELLAHIGAARDRHQGPMTDDAPLWIPHFLGTMCTDSGLGLNDAFFQSALEAGKCLVILDGLDEAPTDELRVSISRLAERASNTFAGCRFVVTTRPAAYKHEVILSGFAQVQVDALEKEAIDLFLTRWCQALFPENPRRAEQHCDELRHALRSRIEIRRMARNPVMLTALAVMYWNEKRIPEQRADLYESIIGWLSRARKREEGRPSPERCVGLLQNLAIAMQNHPDGRQVQVTRHWAARAIAPQWRELPKGDQTAAAEAFLVAEEIDSGIIVGRGAHVRFWHLTFQEFLAARELASMAEDEQAAILQEDAHLYSSEWKEVVLLLAGVLYHQGISRVDRFISNTIDDLGEKPTLAEKALCVGLLGAAVNDLSPVRYRPNDERYQQLLDSVLAIFEVGWYIQPPNDTGFLSRIFRAFAPKMSEEGFIDVAIKAADALGQAGDPRFSEANRKKNWVAIEGGTFTMGESGQEVSVDAFEIGRYPVTVDEFRLFVEHDGYLDEQWWTAGGFGENKAPDNWDDQLIYPTRPVAGVSWYEAAAYAAFMGCRLPTEEEWELAARGVEGREYPWGDQIPNPSIINFGRNVGHPTPAGVYPLGATLTGICDMAGNVWEWCDSWYDEHKDSRVLHGGAFADVADVARAACRLADIPGGRWNGYGFRLART